MIAPGTWCRLRFDDHRTMLGGCEGHTRQAGGHGRRKKEEGRWFRAERCVTTWMRSGSAKSSAFPTHPAIHPNASANATEAIKSLPSTLRNSSPAQGSRCGEVRWHGHCTERFPPRTVLCNVHPDAAGNERDPNVDESDDHAWLLKFALSGRPQSNAEKRRRCR